MRSFLPGVSIRLLSEDIYEANSLFNKAVADSDDSFVAMNTAFANNGIAIEVVDKVVLDKPIMLQYIGSDEDYSVRNLFTFGKFSEATIIEKFDSVESAKFSNIVNEIAVDEQANIKYFKIENDRENSLHIATLSFLSRKTAHLLPIPSPSMVKWLEII